MDPIPTIKDPFSLEFIETSRLAYRQLFLQTPRVNLTRLSEKRVRDWTRRQHRNAESGRPSVADASTDIDPVCTSTGREGRPEVEVSVPMAPAARLAPYCVLWGDFKKQSQKEESWSRSCSSDTNSGASQHASLNKRMTELFGADPVEEVNESNVEAEKPRRSSDRRDQDRLKRKRHKDKYLFELDATERAPETAPCPNVASPTREEERQVATKLRRHSSDGREGRDESRRSTAHGTDKRQRDKRSKSRIREVLLSLVREGVDATDCGGSSEGERETLSERDGNDTSPRVADVIDLTVSPRPDWPPPDSPPPDSPPPRERSDGGSASKRPHSSDAPPIERKRSKTCDYELGRSGVHKSSRTNGGVTVARSSECRKTSGGGKVHDNTVRRKSDAGTQTSKQKPPSHRPSEDPVRRSSDDCKTSGGGKVHNNTVRRKSDAVTQTIEQKPPSHRQCEDPVRRSSEDCKTSGNGKVQDKTVKRHSEAVTQTTTPARKQKPPSQKQSEDIVKDIEILFVPDKIRAVIEADKVKPTKDSQPTEHKISRSNLEPKKKVSSKPDKIPVTVSDIKTNASSKGSPQSERKISRFSLEPKNKPGEKPADKIRTDRVSDKDVCTTTTKDKKHAEQNMPSSELELKKKSSSKHDKILPATISDMKACATATTKDKILTKQKSSHTSLEPKKELPDKLDKIRSVPATDKEIRTTTVDKDSQHTKQKVSHSKKPESIEERLADTKDKTRSEKPVRTEEKSGRKEGSRDEAERRREKSKSRPSSVVDGKRPTSEGPPRKAEAKLVSGHERDSSKAKPKGHSHQETKSAEIVTQKDVLSSEWDSSKAKPKGHSHQENKSAENVTQKDVSSSERDSSKSKPKGHSHQENKSAENVTQKDVLSSERESSKSKPKGHSHQDNKSAEIVTQKDVLLSERESFKVKPKRCGHQETKSVENVTQKDVSLSERDSSKAKPKGHNHQETKSEERVTQKDVPSLDSKEPRTPKQKEPLANANKRSNVDDLSRESSAKRREEEHQKKRPLVVSRSTDGKDRGDRRQDESHRSHYKEKSGREDQRRRERLECDSKKRERHPPKENIDRQSKPTSPKRRKHSHEHSSKKVTAAEANSADVSSTEQNELLRSLMSTPNGRNSSEDSNVMHLEYEREDSNENVQVCLRTDTENNVLGRLVDFPVSSESLKKDRGYLSENTVDDRISSTNPTDNLISEQTSSSTTSNTVTVPNVANPSAPSATAPRTTGLVPNVDVHEKHRHNVNQVPTALLESAEQTSRDETAAGTHREASTTPADTPSACKLGEESEGDRRETTREADDAFEYPSMLPSPPVPYDSYMEPEYLSCSLNIGSPFPMQLTSLRDEFTSTGGIPPVCRYSACIPEQDKQDTRVVSLPTSVLGQVEPDIEVKPASIVSLPVKVPIQDQTVIEANRASIVSLPVNLPIQDQQVIEANPASIASPPVNLLIQSKPVIEANRAAIVSLPVNLLIQSEPVIEANRAAIVSLPVNLPIQDQPVIEAKCASIVSLPVNLPIEDQTVMEANCSSIVSLPVNLPIQDQPLVEANRASIVLPPVSLPIPDQQVIEANRASIVLPPVNLPIPDQQVIEANLASIVSPPVNFPRLGESLFESDPPAVSRGASLEVAGVSPSPNGTPVLATNTGDIAEGRGQAAPPQALWGRIRCRDPASLLIATTGTISEASEVATPLAALAAYAGEANVSRTVGRRPSTDAAESAGPVHVRRRPSQDVAAQQGLPSLLTMDTTTWVPPGSGQYVPVDEQPESAQLQGLRKLMGGLIVATCRMLMNLCKNRTAAISIVDEFQKKFLYRTSKLEMRDRYEKFVGNLDAVRFKRSLYEMKEVREHLGPMSPPYDALDWYIHLIIGYISMPDFLRFYLGRVRPQGGQQVNDAASALHQLRQRQADVGSRDYPALLQRPPQDVSTSQSTTYQTANQYQSTIPHNSVSTSQSSMNQTVNRYQSTIPPNSVDVTYPVNNLYQQPYVDQRYPPSVNNRYQTSVQQTSAVQSYPQYRETSANQTYPGRGDLWRQQSVPPQISQTYPVPLNNRYQQTVQPSSSNQTYPIQYQHAVRVTHGHHPHPPSYRPGVNDAYQSTTVRRDLSNQNYRVPLNGQFQTQDGQTSGQYPTTASGNVRTVGAYQDGLASRSLRPLLPPAYSLPNQPLQFQRAALPDLQQLLQQEQQQQRQPLPPFSAVRQQGYRHTGNVMTSQGYSSVAATSQISNVSATNVNHLQSQQPPNNLSRNVRETVPIGVASLTAGRSDCAQCVSQTTNQARSSDASAPPSGNAVIADGKSRPAKRQRRSKSLSAVSASMYQQPSDLCGKEVSSAGVPTNQTPASFVRSPHSHVQPSSEDPSRPSNPRVEKTPGTVADQTAVAFPPTYVRPAPEDTLGVDGIPQFGTEHLLQISNALNSRVGTMPALIPIPENFVPSQFAHIERYRPANETSGEPRGSLVGDSSTREAASSTANRFVVTSVDVNTSSESPQARVEVNSQGMRAREEPGSSSVSTATTWPKPQVATPVSAATTWPKPQVATPVSAATTWPKPQVATPVSAATTSPKPQVATPVSAATTLPKSQVATPVSAATTFPKPQVATPVSTATTWPKPQAATPVSTATTLPKPQVATPVSAATTLPKPQGATHVSAATTLPKPQGATPVSAATTWPKPQAATPVSTATTSHKPQVATSVSAATTLHKPQVATSVSAATTLHKPQVATSVSAATTLHKPQVATSVSTATTLHKPQMATSVSAATTLHKPQVATSVSAATTSPKSQVATSVSAATISCKPQVATSVSAATTSHKPQVATSVSAATTSHKPQVATSVSAATTSHKPQVATSVSAATISCKPQVATSVSAATISRKPQVATSVSAATISRKPQAATPTSTLRKPQGDKSSSLTAEQLEAINCHNELLEAARLLEKMDAVRQLEEARAAQLKRSLGDQRTSENQPNKGVKSSTVAVPKDVGAGESSGKQQERPPDENRIAAKPQTTPKVISSLVFTPTLIKSEDPSVPFVMIPTNNLVSYTTMPASIEEAAPGATKPSATAGVRFESPPLASAATGQVEETRAKVPEVARPPSFSKVSVSPGKDTSAAGPPSFSKVSASPGKDTSAAKPPSSSKVSVSPGKDTSASKPPYFSKVSASPGKDTSASKPPSFSKVSASPGKDTSASKPPSFSKVSVSPGKDTSAAKPPSVSKVSVPPEKNTSAARPPSFSEVSVSPRKDTSAAKPPNFSEVYVSPGKDTSVAKPPSFSKVSVPPEKNTSAARPPSFSEVSVSPRKDTSAAKPPNFSEVYVSPGKETLAARPPSFSEVSLPPGTSAPGSPGGEVVISRGYTLDRCPLIASKMHAFKKASARIEAKRKEVRSQPITVRRDEAEEEEEEEDSQRLVIDLASDSEDEDKDLGFCAADGDVVTALPLLSRGTERNVRTISRDSGFQGGTSPRSPPEYHSCDYCLLEVSASVAQACSRCSKMQYCSVKCREKDWVLKHHGDCENAPW